MSTFTFNMDEYFSIHVQMPINAISLRYEKDDVDLSLRMIIPSTFPL